MGVNTQNNDQNASTLLNLMISELASRTSCTVQVCRGNYKVRVEWMLKRHQDIEK